MQSHCPVHFINKSNSNINSSNNNNIYDDIQLEIVSLKVGQLRSQQMCMFFFIFLWIASDGSMYIKKHKLNAKVDYCPIEPVADIKNAYT